MTDAATPNLPSRNFDVTADFYARLGFEPSWRDAGWMILKRGALTLEFFPHPDLDPATSWFSCCLRLDDLDGFYAVGWPRLHAPKLEPWGGRVGALIDPDCTLVRLIQN
jgi:hypothetical protein